MTDFTLHLGDCLETLKTLPDCSVDSVITDPPYGLSQHTPQQVADCLGAWLRGEEYKPKGKGFMGKSWDAWVPSPAVWRECLRVLKPGGHLLAFAGTRSMDLMSMAVRLAGFELRDSVGYAHDGGGAPLLAWAYGSGFPKSLDVSKAIDKAAGAEREVIGIDETKAAQQTRAVGTASYGDYAGNDGAITAPATEAARQWQGWGTALKPAWEPIILARKPLDGTVAENVLKHGTGAINVDCCRVGNEPITQHGRNASKNRAMSGANYAESSGRAWTGRWPANLIHDGSDAVMEGFPQTSASPSKVTRPKHRRHDPTNWERATGYAGLEEIAGYGDSGSAARFFYCAKASKKDRDDGLDGFDVKRTGGMQATADGSMLTGSGNERTTTRANVHPTVKPTALMRYLCRLVTPPSGTVLDPFTGSGSTGKAAILEGFNFIGCELDPDYMTIAEARIRAACGDKHQELEAV